MELTELELTGYIVVAWRSADPLDKDMVVLYFETAQDLDVWVEGGNAAYKTTPVIHLLPEIFMKCVNRAPGYPVASITGPISSYVANTD